MKLGHLPAKPDALIALFEYDDGSGVENFLGGSLDASDAVQVRIRDLSASLAYQTAESIQNILCGYHDNEISITQTSKILDIGHDDANPQRQEYTINFKIRRY